MYLLVCLCMCLSELVAQHACGGFMGVGSLLLACEPQGLAHQSQEQAPLLSEPCCQPQPLFFSVLISLSSFDTADVPMVGTLVSTPEVLFVLFTLGQLIILYVNLCVCVSVHVHPCDCGCTHVTVSMWRPEDSLLPPSLIQGLCLLTGHTRLAGS